MPIDRVDSLDDLADAPRFSLKAAEPFHLQQERRAAEQAAEQHRRSRREKRRQRGRKRGPLPPPNYAGRQRLVSDLQETWKLSSTLRFLKTESEHVGLLGEKLCMMVKVESAQALWKRAQQQRQPPPPSDQEDGADNESQPVETAPAPALVQPSRKNATWRVVMLSEAGDRLIFVARQKDTPARVGSTYLLDAEVIEHTYDEDERAQTVVGSAKLVPMVGKRVARGTLRRWSAGQQRQQEQSSQQDSQEPVFRLSNASQASSSRVVLRSSSLLSNKQVAHPWGRGTAPKPPFDGADPVDPRLRALQRSGAQARQHAVHKELAEHRLSALLQILREQGEDPSVIDSILDEPQPQLAAARRASMPLDTSLSVESLGGVTGSRPPRRQRPSSAGAVVGGGFCSSGRAGLNNEEECMDLLGRRPQSAGPTGGSSYALASSSSLAVLGIGPGAESRPSSGLSSKSGPEFSANLSYQETAAREQASMERQRQIDRERVKATAVRATAEKRRQLQGRKLSELVHELQAVPVAQARIDELLDGKDAKRAVVEELMNVG